MAAILAWTSSSPTPAPLEMNSDHDIALGWCGMSTPSITTTASTLGRLSSTECSLWLHILPGSPPSMGLFPTTTIFESLLPTTHSISSGEQVW